MINLLKQDLQKLANKEKAIVYSRFFKTAPGEYGYGDIFLGLSVPQQREIAKKYSNINLNDIQKLLKSKIHEHRLTALLILIEKYKKTNNKKEFINFYLNNTKYINNWDLVDLSAHQILGNYLVDKDKSILYKLAKSNSLWERRISIIATYHFIKNNKFDETLKISKILLNDNHDLIQKAVGWMLRELGKISNETEEKFLNLHYKNMPRTMLRYAIERFDENKKKFYLNKNG